MIVPHGEGPMKSINLTINLIKVAVAACCFLLVLGLIITWRYYQAKSQLVVIPELQRVNAENKQKIEKTNRQLEEIKEKIKQVEELEKDVRKSLGLKEPAKVEEENETILIQRIPFYHQEEELAIPERMSLPSRGGVTRSLPNTGSENSARQTRKTGLALEAKTFSFQPADSELPEDAELELLKEELELRIKGLQEIKSEIAARDSVKRATPSIWPLAGRITSNFGYRRSPASRGSTNHKGIDIAAPRGTPIKATADGVVTFSGVKSGYGNVVIIRHGYGYTTLYGHNSRNLVKVGEKVKKGQVIALCGSTGISTGPHVHYEVWVNGRPVDPRRFL